MDGWMKRRLVKLNVGNSRIATLKSVGVRGSYGPLLVIRAACWWLHL